jgi:uncharacterized lipoprotein YddW (UPF0748 family)
MLVLNIVNSWLGSKKENRRFWILVFACGFLICQLSSLQLSPVFAAGTASVAMLKSASNSNAYQEQHLGTYDDDLQSFRQVLQASNVAFDEIADSDADSAAKLSSYKVVVVPLLVDVAPSVVAGLTDYQRSGGKILITDGGGTPGAGAQSLDQLAGVTVIGQDHSQQARKLVWPKTPLPISAEFSIGSVCSNMNVAVGATELAKWVETSMSKPAVLRRGNVVFLSWATGVQGEITNNTNLLSSALEELSPGITQQGAVQISFADYQNTCQELDYLTKRTEETINTAKQADLAVPFHIIQQNFDAAVEHVKQFNDAYHDRRFYEADQFLEQARQEFSLAFAQAMPVRPVEARSVWLDRGTIVSTHDPKGMAALFDRLKSAGINVVYFETNNAGFAMFPSNIAVQNPQTLGWDPLGAALKEAHQRGMELHAWLWVFNVGNVKHNPIIGKEPDYPGPVLSTHDLTWALASVTGSLIPPRQSEFWLDPSNPDARRYIKSLFEEVVQRYPVDGIQLDYIRYPFNNRGAEMGFNWYGRMRFEQDTGLSLDKLDEETRQVWQAWKIAQVNSFVKDISATVRQLRPGIRISAAVYAMPRRMRINAIQQEWETWVANGWVDTLNPMTYVQNAKELTNMAAYVRESTADQALVYPGLSIRQLDTAGLVEQLDSARETGTLGTTLFAVAQLDDKKVNVLKMGPYRKEPILTPQSEPLRASRILIDDFAAMVDRYLHDPQRHIMSDRASTNDVMAQIDSIQKRLHELKSSSSATDIESVYKDVSALHSQIKEWLRLEAFIQRGFRAQYIVSYLGQVEAILSYAAHKAKVDDQHVVVSTENQVVEQH